MINNSMSLSNKKALFRKSCVFWKCYHGFLVLRFRFDLCFNRDPYAATEIVQLMTKPEAINTGDSDSTMENDSDLAASDAIMPEGITWNEWLKILREKYEENMQEQKQNQQESMEPTPKKTRKTPTLTKENTLGTMCRSQTANRDTTIEEEEEDTDDIDHNEHSQRF